MRTKATSCGGAGRILVRFRLRRGRPARVRAHCDDPIWHRFFRLASFVIWPIGRTTTWRRDAGVWSVIGNVVWIVVFGWESGIDVSGRRIALDDHHRRNPVRRRMLEDDPVSLML